MSIEINNLTNYKINKKLFRKIIKDILGDKNISIALVKKEEIKKINKKYKNKNQSTDVLSFSNDSEDPFYTPEIVICPDQADNIYQVLIHGLLHVLGYNHKNMQTKQKYYFKKYE
ncbi:MAG: rRNA maturation RNase YbeY [Candidatus Pacebacteria bacterium]|nr:rRNA maturation RNase YbeY [Candidatus Paceibacterota bacterium]